MCSIYLLPYYLHQLLKYVDFSWKTFCQHKLLGFGDQCVSQMFINFFSQNSKLVCSFVSLSLKPLEGNGVVYLTVLVSCIMMGIDFTSFRTTSPSMLFHSSCSFFQRAVLLWGGFYGIKVIGPLSSKGVR